MEVHIPDAPCGKYHQYGYNETRAKKGGCTLAIIQNPTPIAGSLPLSALAALVPILYFFWALAVKRMKGYLAGLSTLALAFLTAVFLYKMPAEAAAMAAVQGAAYGLLPIAWVIIPSVFLYKLSVKTGQFETIRASIVSITEDRRLQALLVAFSFGSFLEGAAGFGAPVAICASLLVGLGFSPLLAAGVCLVANTPPVAFGAIGIPVLAMEGPTGVPALEISKMIGRQLPILAVVIPYYFIVLMCGFRKTNEVLPAILVSGLSFAAAQFAAANWFGPELPDIAAALVSLAALTLFLRFWSPKTVFRFGETGGPSQPGPARTGGAGAEQSETANKPAHRRNGDPSAPVPVPLHARTAGVAVKAAALGQNEFPLELGDAGLEETGNGRLRDAEMAAEIAAFGGGRAGGPAPGPRLRARDILRAWSPFLVLTLMISVWGIPAMKMAFTGHYTGGNPVLSAINRLGQTLTFHPAVPWLHNRIVGENGKPMAAEFKLELLAAAGTAIFLAALITMWIYRVRPGLWLRTLWETAQEMKFSILTVMSVIGFAYIANYSGLSTTLGRTLALTGAWFPLFSALIGWLGVFITGSDTSANLLFGNLQKVTAERVGMEPVLALAANTSGGGTAKMISPQSIAIASAAVGLNGRESELLRFTLKHSLILLAVICLLTYLQSNVLGWMVP